MTDYSGSIISLSNVAVSAEPLLTFDYSPYTVDYQVVLGGLTITTSPRVFYVKRAWSVASGSFTYWSSNARFDSPSPPDATLIDTTVIAEIPEGGA